MKKYISYYFAKSLLLICAYMGGLLMSVGMLQSCDNKDDIENKPTLYIITETMEGLSTYGGTIPVEFLCNLDWVVSTDVSWITLDETNGSQSGTINAQVAKNEDGVERTGTITMSAGTLKKSLSITQKYRDTSTPELSITTVSPIKLDYEGGKNSVSFVCNVEWEASTDVDWITFSGAISGREDGTLNFVVEKHEGDVIREGKVTLTAKGITKTIDIIQQTEAMGGVNLLDTPEEDYSFERITVNKSWPALGEWGGSDSQGIGKFGASATAIRVSPGSPIPHTGASYMFVRMRADEPTSSLDWIWRKLTNLTPGKSYTFSFWYKTPTGSELSQTGNIRVGAVAYADDIQPFSNLLGTEVTFGYIAAGNGVQSSSDEHKKVTYTFSVPVDQTEVFIVWKRNGNQQPFLDDMSLVRNP